MNWANEIHQRLHEEAKLLQHKEKLFPSLFFIVVGTVSVIWLLIRSGRNPLRLNYPCQRLAASNSILFASWIASLVFSTTLGRVFKLRKQTLLYGFCVLLGLTILTTGYREFTPPGSLISPPAFGAGTSTVVWVNDSRAATDWSSNSVTRVNAGVADEMMLLGLKKLTGAGNAAGAWAKLFSDHNGGSGYQQGERVAIKLNFNNSSNPSLHNPNVASVNALIKTLVDAGVPQNNIVLYDSTRDFVADFESGVTARFPNVSVDPSEADSFCDNVFGTKLTCLLNNVDYLIDMPLLRTHYYCGVTLAFKNHLGSTQNPSKFHYTFLESDPNSNGLVQLYSSPNIKNKTVLVVTDGIYGLKSSGPDSAPTSSSGNGITNPFPNSYFLTTDPVANDSVAIDFIQSRGGDFRAYNTPVNPRVYLSAAASVGLGNYDTNSSFNYSKINLIRCTDGSCSGSGPPPSPSPSPSPSSSPQITPSPTPSASGCSQADISQDGRVNLADFTILAASFMSTNPTNRRADINGDGTVNLADFTLLAGHFMQICNED